MSVIASRRHAVPADLKALAANLLHLQVDLARVNRELREQANLMNDDVAAAVLEGAADLYDTYPPFIEAMRDLLARHKP